MNYFHIMDGYVLKKYEFGLFLYFFGLFCLNLFLLKEAFREIPLFRRDLSANDIQNNSYFCNVKNYRYCSNKNTKEYEKFVDSCFHTCATDRNGTG